ncbi:MAG TPA: caspase family protein [Polyangia bacterium]|nr:caspase family protein [Polyangia bacterium]
MKIAHDNMNENVPSSRWWFGRRRKGAVGGLALALAIVLSSASAPAQPAAAAPSPADKTVVKRFALITGASRGGADRVPLRFASSDANAMRHVLTDLGGLGESETIQLNEVGRDSLRDGFDRVKRLVAAARTPGARTEMVFYYSGHSDETGLLLGNERVTYSEVRSWVDDTGADVRIAVLDSCASGALTRGKGGVHRPPFLVDTSSAARGHAYLTASAENEAAQESDRLGAAYFTHYLVSGLRGAADVSHDGRVTLSEAYQYAFTETLARTQESRGGPQHASYDFQLAGKGDLVMTDLRATNASLVLPADLAGRLFVRDAHGQLIAEVHKLPAQPIELGLPPGRYRITLDDNRRLSEGTVDLIAGQQNALNPGVLVAMVPTSSRSRGTGDAGDEVTADATAVTAVPMGLPLPGNPALGPARPSHFNFAIYPGLDMNGGVPSDDQVVLGFVARSRTLTGASLNVFGHQVQSDVRGAQLSGFGNLTSGDVTGTQLSGLVNVTRGSVTGGQLAGWANWNGGDLRGFQLGGLANVVGGHATGLQLGGLANWTGGGVRGLQGAGLANIAGGDAQAIQLGGLSNYVAGNAVGLQLAGIANVTKGSLRGLQLSGIANLAGAMEGAQIAVVNIGGDVTGTQIGVVNVARRVRGLQLGVVNVASDAESAASIGLVTFVRNGIHELELSTNESLTPVLSGVLGSKYVFTRLGVGLQARPSNIPGARTVEPGSPEDRQRVFLQWGVGGRIPVRDRLFVDVEGIATTHMQFTSNDEDPSLLTGLRVLGGYRVAPHLTLVFGPSYNVGIGWSGRDPVTSTGVLESVHHSGTTTIRMYPGLILGLRV